MKPKYRKVKIEVIKDSEDGDVEIFNLECSKIIFENPVVTFKNGRKIALRMFINYVLNISMIDVECEYFLPLYLDAVIRFLPKEEKEIYELWQH